MNPQNSLYQHMARYVRSRYVHSGMGIWPGKSMNAPAVSRYPNILAELAMRICPDIQGAAEAARISPEGMAAVLEDNEDLYCMEFLRLGRYLHVRTSYLAAPVLSTIDPTTNKGKYRLRQLSDLIKLADGAKISSMRRIENIRDAMSRGELVTYASWRWALQEIRDSMERAEQNHLFVRKKRAAV